MKAENKPGSHGQTHATFKLNNISLNTFSLRYYTLPSSSTCSAAVSLYITDMIITGLTSRRSSAECRFKPSKTETAMIDGPYHIEYTCFSRFLSIVRSCQVSTFLIYHQIYLYACAMNLVHVALVAKNFRWALNQLSGASPI